jgi:hypothetical protein
MRAVLPTWWIAGPVFFGMLLALRSRLWPVAVGLPFAALAYALFPFFLLWYALPIAPAIWLCAMSGVFGASARQSTRPRTVEVAFVLAMTGMLPLTALHVYDETVAEFEAPELAAIDRAIAQHVRKPALVFFAFPRHPRPFQEESEPVYNTATPWPDDADVVRLHSLDEATDRKAIDYYATRQPDRQVYLFDRTNGELIESGPVWKLAQSAGPGINNR